jgi:hypothetical protein
VFEQIDPLIDPDHYPNPTAGLFRADDGVHLVPLYISSSDRPVTFLIRRAALRPKRRSPRRPRESIDSDTPTCLAKAT